MAHCRPACDVSLPRQGAQSSDVAGAADLFSLIQQKRRHAGRGEPPAIFSSHPLDRQRLDAIADSVRQNGWADTGKVTPLPDAYPTWMADLARHGGAAE